MNIIDGGPNPFVGQIEKLTIQNENYRTTLWTGPNLQVTLMSIKPGGDIGLEVHEDVSQFLRIEQGQASVLMGSSQIDLSETQAGDGDAVIVPAGTWHNLVNIGQDDLKVYSIYAPAEHPHGTNHITKEDAEASENH